MNLKQNNNPLKSIVILSFCLMNYWIGFSQDQNKEDGFYVNYGRTKVEKLDCFNFDNLVYTHEVTEEMLKYDKITYSLGIYNSTLKKYDILNSVRSADGKIFRNKVSDKKSISIIIAGSSLESKIREDLAFTAEETMTEDMVLVISIRGGVISGYEEKWNSYTDSYITEPIYNYTSITPANNTIRVENRKKTADPTLPQTPIGALIYLFISKEKKDRTINTSASCFGYDGSKTFETYLFEDLE